MFASLLKWLVASASCACIAGCGDSVRVVESGPPPTECQRRLIAIGDSYVRANQKHNRPPKSVEELTPFLKVQGKPEELLMSPEDGHKFEIVWGNTLIQMKELGSDIPIIAYERQGTKGVRNVLRGRAETLHLSESELKSGRFPEGYRFPF